VGAVPVEEVVPVAGIEEVELLVVLGETGELPELERDVVVPVLKGIKGV